MKFEWDKRKALINKNKHGVSFEEARTVFFDSEAMLIDDPDHSDDEDRFILLGFSSVANMLVVCHCYQAGDEVIRIFSARKASRKESATYRRRQ